MGQPSADMAELPVCHIRTCYTLATMTRSEAIAAAPATRKDYWGRFALNACLGMGIPWAGMVYHRVSVWIFLGLVSLGCLAAAALYAERLFFPVRAMRRSLRLSTATKERLMTLDQFAGWGFWIATAGLLLLSVFQRSPLSFTRFWGMLVISRLNVQYFINDLCDVKVLPESDDFEHSPPLTDLQPLQSSQWGEAGTTRSIV
ncbi:MAG TPA: hypothetical protein VGN16_04285 [Acidobacteriaceae bacterium]|jgi:hypothetical protein